MCWAQCSSWTCRQDVIFVQPLRNVWLLAIPWMAAWQASLSFTISCSFLKLKSIELVMPSNYLILCHHLLLLPSSFPRSRVFFQQVGSLHQVAKLLELQLKHQSFQWIFRVASSQAPLPMGILQARTLEWVAMPSSRRSSQPRDQTQVSHIAIRFFTIWAMKEAQFPLGLTGLISLLVWKHQSEPCICPLNTSAK